MEKVIRKGIAFEPEQLKEYDKLINKKGYNNRSEAIRDLIRKELIEEKIKNPEEFMMASLTIVYNHHEHEVQHNLTHLQHHHPDLIRSTLHIHMSKEDCMEVLILQGKVKDITHFSDQILAEKGVNHGRLVLTNFN
jgi:CopG family transcriptional regulator, nickel-responsive regulator